VSLGDRLVDEILDAHPERRELLLAGAASIYGDGFARALRATVAERERRSVNAHPIQQKGE
jgi:hypothetical protein